MKISKRFGILVLGFCISLFTNNTMAQLIDSDSISLSEKEKSIIIISSLTAQGNTEKLQTALTNGLDAGLTVNEIKEILVQLYAYCGFPRSLNAINTFRAVIEERKTKGIVDTEGRESMMEKDAVNKYEQGRKTLEALTKMPQPKPAPGYGEFTPRIDAFLKEHLFADIFSCDVLSYQQREFVTIAALASMPGVEAQLKSHIAVGKNTGITESQLEALALLVEKYSSATQANTLRKLINKPTIPIIKPDIMVRIAEIEIHPEHLESYKIILKLEAAASVKAEPGVIAIFPMYQKDNPVQVRIIEIYADKDAYQSHLKTPHFLHYKTSTAQMVKSLKLVEMTDYDKETIELMFAKIK
jgi:4-carboxymuconolactone decarboxylase